MKNVFETKLIYKTLLKTEFLQASMSLQGNHKHTMKITTRNDNLLLPVPLLPRRSPQEYLGFSIHSKVIAPSVLFGTAALICRGKKKKKKKREEVSWWQPQHKNTLMVSPWAFGWAGPTAGSTAESHQPHSGPSSPPQVRGRTGYLSHDSFKLQKHKCAWFFIIPLDFGRWLVGSSCVLNIPVEELSAILYWGKR